MALVKIAFEGFDGCGKGTAIDELMKLIKAEKYETKKDTKTLRRDWLRTFGDGPELHNLMVASYREEWALVTERAKGLQSGTVLLIDRSWASYETNRFANLGGEVNWLNSCKPDVVLSLRVQENLRVPRILERDGSVENLNDRERRLMNDPDFREKLNYAEMKLGCTPLRIRQRSPEVVAMRVLQNLLARPGFTYVPRA